MRRHGCPSESEIAQAVRAGEDLQAHREHLARCRRCRETALVAGVLGELADETRRSATVPDASMIWWRSRVVLRLVEQDRRIERRSRALMLAQIAAGTVAVIVVVAALAMSDSMADLVGGFLSLLPGDASAAELVGVMAMAAVASLAVGAVCAWGLSEELR